MGENSTESPSTSYPEAETFLKALNEQGGLREHSFGDVAVRALQYQLAGLDPSCSDPFALNRLLENPIAARYIAALLLGLSKPFRVSVRVPGYAWLTYVANKDRVLVDANRRKYERFALNRVPLSERLTGRRKMVHLTLVCAMKPVTAEEAVALIRSRGLRPAHPIEDFQLANRRPDLLQGPAAVTILGRSLCLRQWPDQGRDEPLPSFYLTLWRKKNGLTTYLEPTQDRVYPAYTLFLAAEL